MAITIVQIGATADEFWNAEIERYFSKLKHYAKVEQKVLLLPKKYKTLDAETLKIKEGEMLLESISSKDYIILLDENGKEYGSEAFATLVENRQMRASNVVFVIGGAYGFSEKVYAAANEKIALSKMTFTHQMVRLFFMEQLYRAFTILKGENYHHS